MSGAADFLASSALPRGADASDAAFRGHAALLRRTTVHPFDLNRLLFMYKPLAKAHAILAVELLRVSDQDKATSLPLALRSAVAYVTGNALQSVYVMVLSAELKSVFRPRPPAEGFLPDVVLAGDALSSQEAAALDFAQELCGPAAHVSEDVRRRVLDGAAEADGQLERLVGGVAAYTTFLAALADALDLDVPIEAVHFATHNLGGLPWRPRGGHFRMDESIPPGDPFALDPSGNARQRLTRGRRSARVNRDRGDGSRTPRAPSGMRRVSTFLSNSIQAPRVLADATRTCDSWMRAALLPPPGAIFEMNDLLARCWGFEPFFLATSATAGEPMRRAFVLAAKDLLFAEKETSRRTKFVACYVLAVGLEERRAAAAAAAKDAQDTGMSSGRMHWRALKPVDYDALAILAAHAAFLACKYGASPAELRAARDAEAVRHAAAAFDSGTPEASFPLSRRDCAAALVAHDMAARPGPVSESTIARFEGAFGSPLKQAVRGGRICHRAYLEVVGACALWAGLTRYAAAALAFDIDMTSNLMFGAGRAEPVVVDFAASDVGKDIGLSLHTDEVEAARARRDSKVGRMSSMMSASGRPARKRSTSALANGTGRVVRMLSNIGPNANFG